MTASLAQARASGEQKTPPGGQHLGTDLTPHTISSQSHSPLTPPSDARTRLSRRTALGARTISDRSVVPIHHIESVRTVPTSDPRPRQRGCSSERRSGCRPSRGEFIDHSAHLQTNEPLSLGTTSRSSAGASRPQASPTRTQAPTAPALLPVDPARRAAGQPGSTQSYLVDSSGALYAQVGRSSPTPPADATTATPPSAPPAPSTAPSPGNVGSGGW